MTIDTLVKKLRKHENKLMNYAGVTLIVGMPLACCSYLMYNSINAASEGDSGTVAVAGIFSIICAYGGGYITGHYRARSQALKIKTKNLNL